MTAARESSVTQLWLVCWAIFVGVGKPNKDGSGGTIAAPAFSRDATRALAL